MEDIKLEYSYIMGYSRELQELIYKWMKTPYHIDKSLMTQNMNYVICYDENFKIIGIANISNSPILNFKNTTKMDKMKNELTDNVSYVNALYVDEDYRGMGIAKTLLQHLYLIWIGSGNKYLNGAVRATSGLYKSGYYDNFQKYGKYTNKNGDYEIYIIEKYT